MRDSFRTLTWVFLLVGLASAAAVVIAAVISNSGNGQVTTPSAPLTQPVIQTSSLPLPTPQGKLVFDESFDDNLASGMATSSTDWKLVENSGGGKAFQMDNRSGADWISFSLGSTTISNGTIEYKEKLVDYNRSLSNGSGAVACHFRSSSQDRYLLALQADLNQISINHQGIATNNMWVFLSNAVAPFIFKEDNWYAIRIDIKGNEVIAYLDGKKVLTAKDDKLKTGEIFSPSRLIPSSSLMI